MDSIFDITDYRPTKPSTPGDGYIPTGHHLESLFSQLRDQTRNIVKHPYDPDNWARRAETLSSLRYPELVVGDTHKADLLCRAHACALDAAKGSSWRLGHRMGFWMENPLHEFWTEDSPHVSQEAVVGSQEGDDDYHRRLKRHLSILQRRVGEIESSNLYHYPVSDVYKGQMLRRMYPWMEQRHRERDGKLLNRLNREFAHKTATTNGKPFCSVKRDAFGDGNKDVLGVFATQDIYEQEVILIDETTIWGSHPSQKSNNDLQAPKRKTCAGAVSRRSEVKFDLSWIRDETNQQAGEAGHVLLFCRLLLSTIFDSVDHPLSNDLIARLTPTYNESKIFDFYPLTDIAIPNQALQMFGIDIFANLKYDTWVLFSIQERISNNSCNLLGGASLNPLFALFNHSCDPNLDWSSASGNYRSIVVRARKNIRQGEQLLVEYDQFMRDKPLHTRRKQYYSWLDAPCQCIRCRAEEAVGWNLEQVDSDWDDAPLIEFPEDSLKN